MSSLDDNPTASIGLYGKSWQAILTSIIPTKDDETKLQSCFDKIKRILSDECKLGNLVKVGSYGKRTHIKTDNKFPDIDIIIFYPKFHPTEEEYSKKINQLLEIVKKYNQDFTSIKSTLYSVQAIVDNINVDILPAMEIDDPTRFIMKMKDDPNTQRCLSACASLVQKNFIQAQSNLYREMVRLVKYWKSKQQWTLPGSVPISYLLELLMLDVYNRYAHLETETSVYGGLFQRFLDSAIRLSSKTRITFNTYYHDTVTDVYHRTIFNTVSGEIPVILDPANPSMNVASRLSNSQPLREYAQSTLNELQMTMSRCIDTWITNQQRLLSRNQRLVAFQNFLLKTKMHQIFSIKNIKVSALNDVQSSSAQTGPFVFRIGADIETVNQNKKYWRVYLFVESVHQDWTVFKDDIIGVSKNVRFDFKVQISQERSRVYETISKQWTATPTAGHDTYLTTKEEKLKYNYNEHAFDISEHYFHYTPIDIQCEVTLVLYS